MAVKYNFFECIEILCYHCAKVNTSISISDSDTPLHKAISLKAWKSIEVLLTYGADVNITNKNNDVALF